MIIAGNKLSIIVHQHCFRTLSHTQPIKTDDGQVIEGDANHTIPPASEENIDIEVNIADTTTTAATITTTTTTTTKTPGIIVRPVNENGSPLEGARVTLKCTEPQGKFIGVENSEGEYIFEYGIPGDGRIECELTVEKEG